MCDFRQKTAKIIASTEEHLAKGRVLLEQHRHLERPTPKAIDRVEADPQFKESLRELLWEQLQRQQKNL